MSEADVLTVRNITSGYGGSAVLRDVSLTLARGEALAVLGKNGMGKTTLLKTIFGLIPPRGGDIRFEGSPQSSPSPSQLTALGVSYAPQEQPLFQDLSVRDNLRLALPRDSGLDAALAVVFEHFPFLSERLKQRAGTLSGGEQKMLILARALMVRPRLVLLDEISEGVQPSVLDRIVEALQRARTQSRTAMLIVEQNLEFAMRVADRWVALQNGEIQASGSCDAEALPLILSRLSW